jgi:hypothetical protein
MSIGIDPFAPVPDVLPDEAIIAVAAPLPPSVLPRKLRIQASYRQLVCSGLTGAEAAGLIGYVSGLPQNVSPWSIGQVNKVLFLRALYQESEWGKTERLPAGNPTD